MSIRSDEARGAGGRLHWFVLMAGFPISVLLAGLTPPLQAPDEMQHFARAVQVSELTTPSLIQDGVAGAVLPASLNAMTEHFLGTRALLVPRRVPNIPLDTVWQYNKVKLAPDQREFVAFNLSVLYPPWAYAPQAAGIGVARAVGGGPLLMLVCGRIANAMVAVMLVALAVRVTPIGKLFFALGGLLPMAIFEYGSVNVDAILIGSGLLFTAIMLEMRVRGCWHPTSFLAAVCCALIFCVTKPVYDPLLLLLAPLGFTTQRRAAMWGWQISLLAIVLGVTALWTHFSAPLFEPGRDVTNVPGQIAVVLQHPLEYSATLVSSFMVGFPTLLRTAIGQLGWLNVPMSRPAYTLPVVGCILAIAAEPRAAMAPSRWWSVWDTLLLAGSSALIETAMYLYWTPVGADLIEGVQGRYFLPLIGAMAALACTMSPLPLTEVWRDRARRTVIGIVGAEMALTVWTVATAYGNL